MKNKNVIIAGLVILAIIIVGGFLLLSRNKSQKPEQNQTGNVLPQVEVIPTVDETVIVELITNKAKTEVTLSISNFPKGTTHLEYSLSYPVVDGTIQGTETTEPVDVSSESKYEKKILLGTESSGSRVYHKVSGPINIEIKFSGEYGQKVYQK